MIDINKDLINRLNKEISICELVNKTGIVLKKSGKNFFGLCPFHKEKTPSFSVSIEKNIALCMSCHKGGSPIKFYSQFKNISASEAIQQLAELFNLVLPEKKFSFENPLDSILKSVYKFYQDSLLFLLEKKEYEDHPLINYLLKERKLNKELIKEFGLGYSHKSNNALAKYLVDKMNYKYEDLLKLGLIFYNQQKQLQINDQNKYLDFFRNRLMFPLTNIEGKIVGFCGRSFPEYSQDKKEPKYLFNSSDRCKKENLLYRFFEHKQDIQEKKEVILCEGFFDVISFYKIGMKNTVAVLGTHLNRNQMISLKSIASKIIIALDEDDAGKIATEKMALELNKNKFMIKILNLPSGFDPDQYITSSKQDNIDFLKQKLEERIKNYIFIQIDRLMQEGWTKDQIQLNIESLLKYHNKDTIQYFKNKINEKYQIQINLLSFISIKETNNQLLKQKQDKISLKDIIQKNNKEINILTELFLNPKYIDLVLEESYKYSTINFDIIELIRKIKEYYNKYITDEEKSQYRINISNFKNVYKSFLDNINDSIKIYNLLFRVENNPVFRQKKKIENPDYLKSLFYPFEIEEDFVKQQEIKKEIQILQEKILKEEDVVKINQLFDELKKCKEKLINNQKNSVLKIK